MQLRIAVQAFDEKLEDDIKQLDLGVFAESIMSIEEL